MKTDPETLELTIKPDGSTEIYFFNTVFSEFIYDYVYDDQERAKVDPLGTGNKKIYCG